MHVFSKAEWKALWDSLKAEQKKSISEYAEICSRTKREWSAKYPGVSFANARYEVHLENALRAGCEVPNEYIAAVIDSDLRYDGAGFTELNSRRKK